MLLLFLSDIYRPHDVDQYADDSELKCIPVDLSDNINCDGE